MKAAYRWILIAGAMAIPLSAAAEQAFTVRNVEVFAGPSGDYPPIAMLPPNANVNIVGCLADWTWCDVIFYGDRGWVYAGDLVVPYQGSRAAIVDYGPRVGITVVTFSIHSYWDQHYRARPWYAEREQWATRVRIEGGRGGKPPEARTPRDAPPPARSQAQPPVERPQKRPPPEAGRAPPAAGGKPPAAEPPRGAPPQAGLQGKPPAERPKDKGEPPGRGKGAEKGRGKGPDQDK